MSRVTPRQRQLFGQQDGARAGEGGAEQVGQVEQQPFGLARPGMDQRGAGIERVEQEVRVDARLQGFELGLFRPRTASLRARQ